MTVSLDRRSKPRSESSIPQGFRIKVQQKGGEVRTLAAKLVDFSEQGVGVEMFVPLKVGRLVAVAGDLRSEDIQLLVDGQARVVYSRRVRRGNYRIGLALEEVAYYKTA
jgi:hypothetical protein